jgi:hypothetical protein
LYSSQAPNRRDGFGCPTATNSLNIARAAVGRIAIDRTKLTVGSREFEMAWLVRRSFVQGGHPTLPLCTRYFESDERGTYLWRTRGLRLEKYGLKLRRVILIAIRLLLRQLSVTYGNCSLSAGDFSQYAGLPMTNDFTEKLIDVTVLRAGGPILLFRYPWS